MTDDRPQLKLWLIGLGIFGLFLLLRVFTGDASQYGIVDHQAAGSAAVVDTIQADWRANGIRTVMIMGMIADFIFIAFYGWGGYVAGRGFYRSGAGVIRIIGAVIAAAAIVFLVTDYIETVLQFIQLLRDAGSDWMAATAAIMQPIKQVAFIVVLLAIILALAVRRFSQSDA
jgi:hypothetical protein